jgi:uncharacterized short protein YbdD (DUF466 family)
MLGRWVGGEAGKGVGGEALVRLASILRQISGMPKYDEYVRHTRRSHPQTPVLSEKEFYDEYLDSRYADGPTRCC